MWGGVVGEGGEGGGDFVGCEGEGGGGGGRVDVCVFGGGLVS